MNTLEAIKTPNPYYDGTMAGNEYHNLTVGMKYRSMQSPAYWLFDHEMVDYADFINTKPWKQMSKGGPGKTVKCGGRTFLFQSHHDGSYSLNPF